ncbi:MAG: Cys-tRNA(Pro) deacylase [Nitrospirae bacterium]|nr:Cys-tRNA(Pro) deacylase [Nitrospirota bacterium]
MAENMPSATAAVEVLRAAGIEHSEHVYAFEETGGTALCAQELNIDEHAIVKTIVLEADGKPFIVLMHGDMRASTKELAGIIGARSITPCSTDNAEQYTGYQFGGISPFGTRSEMPIYMEETILNLRKVYINGGRRGYMIGMDPYDIVKILHPVNVKVGAARGT